MQQQLSVDEQLAELGTGTHLLTDADRRRLDEDGVLVLPGMLTSQEVIALRAAFDRLAVEEGEQAGIEVHQEAGTSRLSDLVNKDPVFERCWSHPLQLAAVGHVLAAPFKLSSLNARAPLPGSGLQALHTDWHLAPIDDEYQVCNSIWMLDDFTEENGATRVVPASHRSGLLPHEAMENTVDSHPDEILLLGTAGTVVIMNSHVWHGGTLNHSGLPRRGVHGYFVQRTQGQQLNQRDFIRANVRDRLTVAQRHLLDI